MITIKLVSLSTMPIRLMPWKRPLLSLRELCPGRLICVFGCGGDRDEEKRPQMGCIAERHADQVILTNDNPRNEQPLHIIDDIVTGIAHPERVRIEPDRCRAILSAIESADAGDVVLIAGKGHETYQEISGKRTPFSDRQVVRNYLEGKR